MIYICGKELTNLFAVLSKHHTQKDHYNHLNTYFRH